MKRLIALLLLSPFIAGDILAEGENASSNIEYKKARVLQAKNAKKMSKVYEILESKGCPMPFSSRSNISSILDQIVKSSNSNEYDKSVAWNTYGYLYSCHGEHTNAITSYTNVVNNTKVTYPLRNAALKILAQLHLVVEPINFDQADYFLTSYFDASPTLVPDDFGLQGIIYAYKGDAGNAYESLVKAIAFAELELFTPKKSWKDTINTHQPIKIYLEERCSHINELDSEAVIKCMDTKKAEDILIAKEAMKILIKENSQSLAMETNSRSSNDKCLLCGILKEAIIAYPEAKAKAEREAAIRRNAYIKGQNDARAACRGSISC